jgi:hypothetical protein
MAMQNKQSFARRWEDYQPSKTTLVMVCAATAIVTMSVGFSWGGWVTGGTSQSQAETAGDTARSELAAAICIEKFNAASDRAAQLVTLKAITGTYKKREYVEAGGWATMPGQTQPDRRGAEACATALAA